MYICMFVIIMNNIDINTVINILLVIHIYVYSYERPVVRFPWLRNGLLKTSRIIADIYVHLCRFQQYKIMNHSFFGITHVVLFHFSIGPMRHLSKTVATNNCIVCHTMTATIDRSPTGLGFSRPKPVFTVQNLEKLSKTGKNYAGLYSKLENISKNVIYQIRI